MRFLSIFKTAETGETSQGCGEEMHQLIEEMTKAGTLIAIQGCLPSALGARVRRSGSKVVVTDGPFTESKELVAGLVLLETKSKEEAIELARRFLHLGGDGECEIRQVIEDKQDEL